MTKIYFNGKIVDLKKAMINPYDLGILRGYGVFDVMRTINGKPFLLEKHYKRLKNSAEKLKLEVPFSEKDFRKIVEKLIQLNNFLNKDATIRTVLTGGVSPSAFLIQKPTCYILIERFAALPKEIFKKGAKVITIEYERYLPEAKITNYLEPIRHQAVKEKNGALEIIYVKNGKALEASTSNLFIIKNKSKNKKIITPKNNILKGITRGLVINLASEKFHVEERELLEKELRNADEVFLTATNKDIVPVVNIDGKKIGNGKPGEITKNLIAMFDEFLKTY